MKAASQAPVATPEGWAATELGDVLVVEYGKALPEKSRRQGSVEVWSSAGMVGTHDERLATGTNLIVGRKGAAGNVMLAHGDIWAIDTAYYIPVPDELNAQFLAYQLQAANLRQLDQSTAVPSLSRDDLYRFQLRLPSRTEQDQVVHAVEQLFVSIDHGIKALHDAERGCRRLRQSLLTELADPAFPRVRIGEVADVFVGATPSRKNSAFWNGDIAWVSSGEVAFCRIGETRETITAEGLGNPATRLHPPGTVLLAMIGEGRTRGQAAILDIAAAHNQNCASIRLDSELMLPEFLFYVLMEQYERNRQVGSGSQQPALNGGLVRELLIPCPTRDIQIELVARLDAVMVEIDTCVENLASRRADADRLKRSVLHQAFTGQLLAQPVPEFHLQASHSAVLVTE